MSNNTNTSICIVLFLDLFLGKGSCDFETDWCGWREHSNSNYSRWLRMVHEEIASGLSWRGKLIFVYI